MFPCFQNLLRVKNIRNMAVSWIIKESQNSRYQHTYHWWGIFMTLLQHSSKVCFRIITEAPHTVKLMKNGKPNIFNGYLHNKKFLEPRTYINYRDIDTYTLSFSLLMCLRVIPLLRKWWTIIMKQNSSVWIPIDITTDLWSLQTPQTACQPAL